MSIIRSKFAEVLSSAALWAAGLAALLFLPSCSLIYDGQEDCDFGLYLRFRYDYNMSFGDAFASQVSRVSVFVFDENGEFVASREESGKTLGEEGYRMKFELPAGTYEFLCWGGKYDDSFHHPKFSEGQIPDIGCLEAMLRREADCSVRCQDGKPLRSLFWGKLENVDIRESERQEETLSLMKLTNQIKVNLVNASGEPISTEDVTFHMKGANGRICADDACILDDDVLTYLPYHTSEIATGIGLTSTKASAGKGVSAELSCPRITCDDASLTLHAIDKASGKDVLDFPVAEYLSNYRPSAYETADGIIHFLDAQEYLDRQDLYNLTFIIKDGTWISVDIHILAWSMRVHNVNL